MKTDPKTQNAVSTVAAKPGTFFRTLLSRPAAAAKAVPAGLAPSKLPVSVAGRPVASAAAASTQQARSAAHTVGQGAVKEARTHHEAEAGRLDTVRSASASQGQQLEAVRTESSQLTRQQLKDRAVELIANELVSAFSGVGSRVANDSGKGSRRPGVPVPAMVSSRGSAPQHVSPDAASEPGTDVENKAAQATALIEKIELFVKNNQRPALALTLNNTLGARVEIERIGPGEVALKLVGQRGPPSPEAVSRIREELQARGLKVAALSVA